MMEIFVIICLVVALVLFIGGFFNAGNPRWNLVSGGLVFLTLALLLEHIPA